MNLLEIALSDKNRTTRLVFSRSCQFTKKTNNILRSLRFISLRTLREL